jgi:hypothetical protein
MRKIVYVARREFLATVATKGFLVGVLLTPAIIAFMIVMLPRLMSEKSPNIDGEVAILDPTGVVAAGVRDYLSPKAIAGRYEEEARRVAEETANRLPALAAAPGSAAAAQKAIEASLAAVPNLEVVELPASADLERERIRCATRSPNAGSP